MVGSKREVGDRSSSLVKMELITPISGVTLLIIISQQTSSKGASSRHGLTNTGSPDQTVEASYRTLASPLEISPICNCMH